MRGPVDSRSRELLCHTNTVLVQVVTETIIIMNMQNDSAYNNVNKNIMELLLLVHLSKNSNITNIASHHTVACHACQEY